jgi:hypothetical protein
MDNELREAVENLPRLKHHTIDEEWFRIEPLIKMVKRVLDAEESLPDTKTPSCVRDALDQAALVIAKNYRRKDELPSVNELIYFMQNISVA